MFDIGIGELLLVLVVGLIVLGPERLPAAVSAVAGWVRTLRSLAATVQNDLSQELRLQELQDNLKKAEQLDLQSLTPELEAPIHELKEATGAMKSTYVSGVGLGEEYLTLDRSLLAAPDAAYDNIMSTPTALPVSNPDNALIPNDKPPTQGVLTSQMTVSNSVSASNKTSVSEQPSSDPLKHGN